MLDAIKWLLKPGALTTQDLFDITQPCRVTGLVLGITEKILDRIPDQKHKKAFEPFCFKGGLWIRVTTQPGKLKEFKQEVWEPEKAGVEFLPEHWRDYPTGIAVAVGAIFPEPLAIRAMKDIEKDYTSVAAGTSIKRLIEEIAEPVTAKHKAEIDASLKVINSLLTSGSENRADALKSFDDRASTVLADFFPGLGLHLDLPETKLKEFFKSGTLRVKETGREGWTDFSQLGSGAQRSIEMALIRYLAEEPGQEEENPPCKLLLIDEPELYLHPQAVRRIRKALLKLSEKGFQVIFSTHSPLMLDRSNTAQTIIVKKDETGTLTRHPLKSAVERAIKDGKAQSAALFQLGNLAEIYFADTVVICEGKTDRRLLPLAYERHFGHSPEHDHIAFVEIGSCTGIRKAMNVLGAMEIKACSIADLDFVFSDAANGTPPMAEMDGAEITETKRILLALQATQGFKLSDKGMPCKGNDWNAAGIWALFAAEAEGKAVCESLHKTLLGHGCWIWAAGCIEHVLGIEAKGEEAIEEQEALLRAMPQADVAKNYPALVACLEWVKS